MGAERQRLDHISGHICSRNRADADRDSVDQHGRSNRSRDTKRGCFGQVHAEADDADGGDQGCAGETEDHQKRKHEDSRPDGRAIQKPEQHREHSKTSRRRLPSELRTQRPERKERQQKQAEDGGRRALR